MDVFSVSFYFKLNYVGLNNVKVILKNEIFV